MTAPTDHPATPAAPVMGRAEFVALMAMLVATVAYSIDAMLPALPAIGAKLSPDAPNQAQLVIGSFVLGLGVGTFFVGALSDAYGRKRVIIWGAALYCAAAILALAAPTLETVLAARVLQGLGAAAARVIAIAIIRDIYKGREMAQLMSFVMLVFTLVPAIAPMAGAGIIAVFAWRGIFVSFLVFAALSTFWMWLRLHEPLPRDRRVPFRTRKLLHSAGEVIRHPMARLSILVQTLCLSMLFASISSIQQIMDITYGRAEEFPYWFAGVATVAALGSVINAALVMRLGMRRLIQMALVIETVVTLAVLATFLGGYGGNGPFALYFVWQVIVFLQLGLTMGNLNALALEPLGHIAGMAASIIAGLSTVGSILLAMPVGLAFNGTPMPLLIGVAIFASLALLLTQFMRKLDRDPNPGL
ncbi:MFS transporter [Roseovarius confluentis]|uniref:MFS transporter n=3 Tax=Roseovarius TaxID=74030 RepID=UPI001FE443CD|nr:MFS transporter [Roseovarius confluentis]